MPICLRGCPKRTGELTAKGKPESRRSAHPGLITHIICTLLFLFDRLDRRRALPALRFLHWNKLSGFCVPSDLRRRFFLCCHVGTSQSSIITGKAMPLPAYTARTSSKIVVVHRRYCNLHYRHWRSLTPDPRQVSLSASSARPTALPAHQILHKHRPYPHSPMQYP